MRRLIKFVLGIMIGAGAAVLLTPKSGRELREQLLGGASGRLLPAAPDEYPLPEHEHVWQAPEAPAEPAVRVEPAPLVPPLTVVAEQPVVVAEPEAKAAEPEPEPAAAEPVAAEPEPEAAVIEPEPAPEPEPAAEPAVADSETELEPEPDAIEAEPEADDLVESAEPAAPTESAEAVEEPTDIVEEPVAEEAERPFAVEQASAPEGASPTLVAVSDTSAVASSPSAPPAPPRVEPPPLAPARKSSFVPPVRSEPPAFEPFVIRPGFEEPAVTEELPAPGAEAPDQSLTVSRQAAEPLAEPAAEPAAGDAGFLAGEDLRARIEETRLAVESDVAQPFAEEEATHEAAAEVGAPEAAADELALGETTTPEAATDEAAAGEPAAGEAAEGEPATAQLPAEPGAEPVYGPEPPAAETAEPVIEPADSPAEPAAAPVAEEPSAREGALDQAEMRRRIEETRARLKAKAFDAMMSGESALLSRDTGAKPVPKPDDAGIDGEVASTIDETLSQEDF